MESAEKYYYFDANALYKKYQEELGSSSIRQLIENAQKPILISRLTVLEVFSRLAKAYRTGNAVQHCRHCDKIIESSKLGKRALSKATEILKEEILHHFPSNDYTFQIIPMPKGVFRAAETIVQQYAIENKLGIGSMDALHLAIVQKSDLDLPIIRVSSDKALLNACEKMKIEYINPQDEKTIQSLNLLFNNHTPK